MDPGEDGLTREAYGIAKTKAQLEEACKTYSTNDLWEEDPVDARDRIVTQVTAIIITVMSLMQEDELAGSCVYDALWGAQSLLEQLPRG